MSDGRGAGSAHREEVDVEEMVVVLSWLGVVASLSCSWVGSRGRV